MRPVLGVERSTLPLTLVVCLWIVYRRPPQPTSSSDVREAAGQCFGAAIKSLEGGERVPCISSALSAMEVSNVKTVQRIRVHAGLAEAAPATGESAPTHLPPTQIPHHPPACLPPTYHTTHSHTTLPNHSPLSKHIPVLSNPFERPVSCVCVLR